MNIYMQTALMLFGVICIIVGVYRGITGEDTFAQSLVIIGFIILVVGLAIHIYYVDIQRAENKERISVEVRHYLENREVDRTENVLGEIFDIAEIVNSYDKRFDFDVKKQVDNNNVIYYVLFKYYNEMDIKVVRDIK